MLFENVVFLGLQDVLEVCTFSPTLGLIYLMKESEIEQSKYVSGKHLSIGRSKYPKVRAI